jgi:hypothetical protein
MQSDNDTKRRRKMLADDPSGRERKQRQLNFRDNDEPVRRRKQNNENQFRNIIKGQRQVTRDNSLMSSFISQASSKNFDDLFMKNDKNTAKEFS